MDLIALYRLVTDHFGSKAAYSEIESGRGVVNVVLYETFIFTCNVNDQHGGFAGGIVLPTDYFMDKFFGVQLSANSDEASIIGNLDVVDDWCRAQLTDRFLDRYEASQRS